MQAFISHDKVVAVAKTREYIATSYPGNCCKGRREEQRLHHSEGNNPDREGVCIPIKPLRAPRGFVGDRLDGLHLVEQMLHFVFIINELLNKTSVNPSVRILPKEI